MKKLFLSLLCGVMVLGLFTGCGKQKAEETPNNNNTNTENISKEEQKEPTINVENWGVQEKKVTIKNDAFVTAWIKFPTLSGITRGTGKIAYQKDKTLVIFDSENKEVFPNITANHCEDVFPAYFEQTKAIIDAYRQMNWNDFNFKVNSEEVMTINGYEMCKFTGKHTSTFKDVNTFEIENIEMNFVAYATKLKGNDAVVYWMVIDESEDQSLGKTIEEYAKNMAYTLHE